MQGIESILHRFSNTTTLHRTFGKENADNILECGFMRKPELSNSDVDLTFHYYGGLLVIDGEGVYIDSDKTEIPLYPGCFVQRLPDRRHSTIVKPDGKWLEAFVCFGRGLYFYLEKIGLVHKDRPVLYPGLDLGLVRKMVSFYEEMATVSHQYLPCMLAKAQDIVFMAHILDENNRMGTKNSVIRQACRMIDDAEGVHIDGRQLSRQLHLGYEVFRKLFKENTGLSPNTYIIQRRTNAAKSLLLNNEKSIKEIALILGYPDQFSFSKQFKQMTGVTPTLFRTQFI